MASVIHKIFSPNSAEGRKLARKTRGLLISAVGDPESEHLVLVHRCVPFGGTLKPNCVCNEHVSRESANQFVQNEQADFLQTVKADGQKYTFRNSVVWRQGRVETLGVRHIRAEERQEEITERRIERWHTRKITNIGKAIAMFRKALTPTENQEWTNEAIHQALVNIDDHISPTVSLAAELMGGQIDDARKKGGSSAVNKILESPEYRRRGRDAAIQAALFKAAVRYSNICLASEGLSTQVGKYLKDAPKGCGLPVSGGNDHAQLALIDGHRASNEDGTKRCLAANFVPGSGGITQNEDGKIVSAGSVYGPGSEPDEVSDSNDYEHIQKNQSRAAAKASDEASKMTISEADIKKGKHKGTKRGEMIVNEMNSLDYPTRKPYEYPEPNEFEVAELRDKWLKEAAEIADRHGATLEEIELLEKPYPKN